MRIPEETLKEILIDQGYVTEEDIEQIDDGKRPTGQTMIDALIAQNLLTKDLLGQAVAEKYDFTYYDLNSKPVTPDDVQLIPKKMAQKFKVLALKDDEDTVRVTTSDPTQNGLEEMLEEQFPNQNIEILYSLREDIEKNFLYYQESLDTRFTKIIDEQGEGMAPEILEEIFEDAFMFEASDIHFEPRQETIMVRFRVDGVLQVAGELPKRYYENITNRIKVMSNLRIDEHFMAQDGSLQYETDDAKYDMRTSIVPTVHGEKVVLRVLTSYIGNLNLANLGLGPRSKQLFTDAAEQPFGMILVTGPTGSGKTTTLYSLLRILNKPQQNITTIEDPVEYKLAGANQIQVNPQKDLTFSKGLRSIVRQDPDIILVGEIRDEETAEISVNAALTGHLLLSTFHSNDAATAIPRLLDMDVEPFLLASTLELLVAQRLVRRVCENCRHSVETKVSDLKKEHDGIEEFFDEKEVTLYEGKGCHVCSNTGYDGRTAVFEVIEVTLEMQNLILTNPSTQEIWELAREQGTQSMFENGIEKVKAGVTTIEEVSRVTPSEHARQKADKK